MASFSTPRVPDGVIAQPEAPQFSSSQTLIRSSREPSPSGGTPIRIRTGKRRSASAIMNPELAAIGCVPILFSRKLAFAQRARKVQLSLATPARRSRANGRFVDALSLLSRWAWLCVSHTQALGWNNCLAASDADCSNAAFFIAHPFAPQFASSHSLIRLSPEPRPSGFADTNTRTTRRSASAIMKPELAVVSGCSMDRTVTHPPNPVDRPLRKPRRSPRSGFPFRWTGFLPSGHDRRHHLGTRLVGAPALVGLSSL